MRVYQLSLICQERDRFALRVRMRQRLVKSEALVESQEVFERAKLRSEFVTRRPGSRGIQSWAANDDVIWVEVEFWSVKKKAALYNHKMSDFAGFVSERLNSRLVLCRAITLKIGKECRTILVLANHRLVTTQPQHSVHPGDIRILWRPFFFLEECCGACDVGRIH